MNTDAFARLLLLLSAIPPAPRQIDTGALVRLLESRGFRVTLRTVQRDLEKLATRFPLACDDETKPFGWSWSQRANSESGTSLRTWGQ